VFRVYESLFFTAAFRFFNWRVCKFVFLGNRRFFVSKVSGWLRRFVKLAWFLRSVFWVNFGFDLLKLASLAMLSFSDVKFVKLVSLRLSKF